ncbi:GNAT family N-acetyltransferase [Streptomyces griseoluteus]|uniref:GNAT family N-acetyltransferase n=1 Tax=Streptomyces griseoluteus TaxID=29306 RepID=UPI00368D4D22
MNNWPLSSLRVTTPLVELRWPTAEDLDALADRAAEGVHAPGFMPFFSQWTDGDRETVAHRVLQRHWRAAAEWRPDDWTLYLAVLHEGEVVGSQSLGARDFAVTREVLLTSWLGLRHQGRGLGGHARAAVLELAFTGLGAHDAFSVVRRGNASSQAVCRKFGFTPDGTQVNAVRGERVVSDRYRLDQTAWRASRSVPVEITGLGGALHMFGAAPAPDATALARRGTGTELASLLSGVRYAPDPDHAHL